MFGLWAIGYKLATMCAHNGAHSFWGKWGGSVHTDNLQFYIYIYIFIYTVCIYMHTHMNIINIYVHIYTCLRQYMLYLNNDNVLQQLWSITTIPVHWAYSSHTYVYIYISREPLPIVVMVMVYVLVMVLVLVAASADADPIDAGTGTVVSLSLVHPFATIGGTTSAGYLMRIVLNVKLVVIRQLQKIQVYIVYT